MSIYGFTLNSYSNEHAFLIAERQNIVRKLSKKIVRTTGIQLASSDSINLLNEYHDSYKKNKSIKVIEEKEVINFSDIDNKEI